MASMTALKYHTRGDQTHQEGDTYEADDSEVANLEAQGLARVTTTDTPAKATKTKAAAAQPDAPATRSTAVEPMTTDAAPLVTPKARNRTTAAPRATKRVTANAKGKRR